jgi:uncharacterized protein with HEPN domain
VSREEKLFLEDVQIACEKILRFTDELTYEQLLQDERTYDAVIRNLEIIGEAVKRLSFELRERYAYIEWKKIAGLWDIITHDYFGIDEEIIWDVIQNHIPDLLVQVNEILSKDSDQNR